LIDIFTADIADADYFQIDIAIAFANIAITLTLTLLMPPTLLQLTPPLRHAIATLRH
jgi:hypothetical protein